MSAGTDIDPDVELLADVPIAALEDDLLDRARLAHRLVELALAAPVTAPRMVALTGGSGTGKSSLLHLVTALLSTRTGIAMIAIDTAFGASAEAAIASLVAELTRLFDSLGVLEAKDKLRTTLSSFGNAVSNVARLAGVRIDVAGALEKSADALRTELAGYLGAIGKRIVIVIDHIDRMPPADAAAMLAALRMYASLPYLSLVIAVDRHELARRLRRDPAVDLHVFERVVQVEIAIPPADRLVLARVMAGGLARIAARTGRDLDAALGLFDPDGGIGLALIETPRDAKRAINAIAAALPLAPADADAFELTLDVLVHVLVPELDPARLDARHRGEPAALYQELSTRLTGHRRAAPTRAALRALLGDDPERRDDA